MKVRAIIHQHDRTPCAGSGPYGGQLLAELADRELPDNGPFICEHKKVSLVVTCELKIPEEKNGQV